MTCTTASAAILTVTIVLIITMAPPGSRAAGNGAAAQASDGSQVEPDGARVDPASVEPTAATAPREMAETVAGPAVTYLGAGRYSVQFRLLPPPGTQSVHLAGYFNDWQMDAQDLKGPDEHGLYDVTLELPRGRHEYKYVINGERWLADPFNPLRAGAHGNSVLLLGVGQADDVASVPTPDPVKMPHLVAHPAAIQQLAASLKGKSLAQAQPLVDAWLRAHPLPMMSDESVTFICRAMDSERDSGATSKVGVGPATQDRASSTFEGKDDPATPQQVYLALKGLGYWLSYEMTRLDASLPIFAVSLRKNELPADATYLFELKSPTGTHTVVDPYAWTVTSRDGTPVAQVVAPDSGRGRIELIPQVVPVRGDLAPRPLYVYLPPGYEQEKGRRYPVIYMHDGQNAWDDPHAPFGLGGWRVNRTADHMITTGRCAPFLVVGIPNSLQRRDEYGPGENILSDDHAYIQFLLRDVKPLIDKRYRTESDAVHTALMGSSMGGIISLQAGLLRPDVFGQVAALSPAFRFEDSADRTYIDLLEHTGKVPIRIYMDSGTGGQFMDGVALTRQVGKVLVRMGWTDGVDLCRVESEGALHNEIAWRARVHRALEFLFPGPAARAADPEPREASSGR
jgi:predicted alpha/beta superfamily hydrolase